MASVDMLLLLPHDLHPVSLSCLIISFFCSSVRTVDDSNLYCCPFTVIISSIFVSFCRNIVYVQTKLTPDNL